MSGAEDLLVDEIRALAPTRPRNDFPGVVDLDPGPVAGWAGLLDRLRSRRFYSGAAMRVDGVPGDPAVTDAVRVLRPLTPADPRPDLGVDRPAQLIELRALHWPHRHQRLLRLPWSTAPVVAEILVRLGKVDLGMRVLDPCTGSGTILITAAHAGAADLIGTDRDHRSVAAARSNVATAGVAAEISVADASRLRIDSGSVDRVLSNLPFGKLVGSHAGNRRLYPALLTEVERVLTRSGRAVLLTEDKRLFLEAVQRTSGLKIIRTRLLSYSGVNPTAYVLGRTRSQARRNRTPISRPGR